MHVLSSSSILRLHDVVHINTSYQALENIQYRVPSYLQVFVYIN